MAPEKRLAFATQHPYDRRVATDAAHRAAQGVLSALADRAGVGDELDDLNARMRVQLTDTIADIIRAAGLRG